MYHVDVLWLPNKPKEHIVYGKNEDCNAELESHRFEMRHGHTSIVIFTFDTIGFI